MILLGQILLYLGLLFALAGDIGFLVVARRRGTAWFWGCLFLPPVWLAFFALNLTTAWKPAALALAGLLIAGVGCEIGDIVMPDLLD